MSGHVPVIRDSCRCRYRDIMDYRSPVLDTRYNYYTGWVETYCTNCRRTKFLGTGRVAIHERKG